MHGVAGVTGDLVQALASAHRLLYGILIVHDFIICKVNMWMHDSFGWEKMAAFAEIQFGRAQVDVNYFSNGTK